MGNNLCATWQKGYRDGCDWPPRKDTHLIRLWAEIFEVREENNEIFWGRVSDDVVPVNVVCIQDTPETTFQITAYNRLVEKIFDVYLTQPGTRIIQASDCFVHWRDVKCDREWGLNFTVPLDAKRFRECCVSRVCQGLSRKAISSDSVKKSQNLKTVTHQQVSPMSQSHCSHSMPRQQHAGGVQEGQDVKNAQMAVHLNSNDAQKQHQHYGTLPNVLSANTKNSQQVQVRQVLSVYVDNRCSCGAECHPVQLTAADRSNLRPQSYTPLGLYTTATENQCCACHCIAQQSHYGYGSVRASGTKKCERPSLYDHIGQHYHALDDNVINQSIYMSSKEARARQMHQEKCALRMSAHSADRGNGYMVMPLKGLEDDGKNRKIEKDLKLSSMKQVLGENGNYKGVVGPKQQSAVLINWPPPPPPADSAAVASPPIDGATDKPSGGPEIPASFDSVTLKRMLRSLSGTLSTESDTPASNAKRSTPSQSPQKYEQSADGSAQGSSEGPTNLNINNSCDLLEGSRDCADSNNSKTDCSVVSDPRDISLVASGTKSDENREEPEGDGAALINLIDSPILPDPGNCERPANNETSQGMASSSVSQSSKEDPSNESCISASDTSHVGDTSHAGDTSHVCDTSQVGDASQTPTNCSGSQAAGYHSRTASGNWPETLTTEVRRLVTSDMSGSECGSDGETGSDTSSIHTVPSQASLASKSMVVRRAGWLTVKNWLVHRKRRIELASKRAWKKYWVRLKGNVLLFYICDEGVEITDDVTPRHKLVIEGSLAQAVPEHPKKENVFSLSSAFGDAYLFQASSQSDLENWISSIHSACAASLARQHGKENTLKLLRNEVHRMETSIDLDIKMKKMATMHLATVNDPRSRHAIEKQINQWEENLEKLYIDHYRLRCYMASLQGSEPPNPKTLLSYVSKSTKLTLGRIGVLTVTTFHAEVCARSPLTSGSAIYNVHKTHCPLSTFKADTITQARARLSRTFSPLPGQTDRCTSLTSKQDECSSQSTADSSVASLVKVIKVRLPNSQLVTVEVNERTTVQELIDVVCNKNRMNSSDHFVRLRLPHSNSFRIPDKTTFIHCEEYESIELCSKLLFQIELVRGERDRDFGLRVEAELADDADQEDELCVFISEITRCGIAYRKGLVVGDEILVINSKQVTELDMVYIENLLADSLSLCLTVRSCRIDRPTTTPTLPEQSDVYIDNMVCPPPPTQARVTDKVIGDLIVPGPNSVQSDRPADEIPDLLRTKRTQDGSEMSTEQIDDLLKGATQVTHICRRQYSCRLADAGCSEGGALMVLMQRPLSNSQHICKVVLELIDTERHYVRDLICLIERYLEPLKEETFLSCDDIDQLFGNIQEIVQFQKLFLHSLEDAVESVQNFNMYHQETNILKEEDLRRVLVLIGSSFMYYAHHFKLYSSFCASHSKAQKMILSDDNIALQEFLRARNPKQQHSATLESFLIKPIQRILKYPLLLKQLNELTQAQTEEHLHLREALHAMEAVAEHINEMQKIYEEYGGVFEELVRQHKQVHTCNKIIDLNVGELQMYGTVNWINATDEIGKLKKAADLLTLVFIFKSAIVLLAQERLKVKKKAKNASGRPSWGGDLPDCTRFKLAIPVDQLQVRTVVGDASDRHGIWEIVYCRSEKEGRPKKVFQFISSHKARNDFIRTIHHTMHESIRRISVATLKARQLSLLRQQGQQHQQQLAAAASAAADLDNQANRNSLSANSDANHNPASGSTSAESSDNSASAGASGSPFAFPNLSDVVGAPKLNGSHDNKPVGNSLSSPNHLNGWKVGGKSTGSNAVPKLEKPESE